MPSTTYISPIPRGKETLYVPEEASNNIKLYDGDNAYPQRMVEHLRNSGTAQSAVNLFCKFVKGRGFTDPNIFNVVVSPSGMKFREVWYQIVRDYCTFKGFALHFRYNSLLEIASIEPVRFEFCRLGKADSNQHVNKIAVFDDWPMKFMNLEKQITPQYVDVFNPRPEVVAKQIARSGGLDKYKGQILYFSSEGAGRYPLCSFHAILEDVITEGKIKVSKLNAVARDFTLNHMVEYPFEAESDEEKAREIQKWQRFQGEEGTGKIMVIWNRDPENPVRVTPFQWQSIDGRHKDTEQSIKESIIQYYNQTPPLRGFMVSGSLGNSQEIENAFKLYNTHTHDDRELLLRVLEDVNSYMAYPLTTQGFEITPLTFEVEEETPVMPEETENPNPEENGNPINSEE